MISEGDDLSDFSMRDLFRMEADGQVELLNEGLLEIEKNPTDAKQLELLMRAAHSIKGAARMVDIDSVVRIAHEMEEIFVAAQKFELTLQGADIDQLLKGVDLINTIAQLNDSNFDGWHNDSQEQREQFVAGLKAIKLADHAASATPDLAQPRGAVKNIEEKTAQVTPQQSNEAAGADQDSVAAMLDKEVTEDPAAGEDKVLRISADRIDRLMGLAGEVLLESRIMRILLSRLQLIRSQQVRIVSLTEKVTELLDGGYKRETIKSCLDDVNRESLECQKMLTIELEKFEEHDRRSAIMASKLQREVIASRMRPFADCVQGFPRMIRDLARQLGKKVDFVVKGNDTQVDSDILEKIKSPLNHMLRNALDHGIEDPETRIKAGKEEQGKLVLEARHHMGMLAVTLSDDGRGINLEKLKQRIIEKKLATENMVAAFSTAEIMEFIFLPGFSTRDQVTEISGRGVGMDVVQDMVQSVRGLVRADSVPGQGMTVHLRLPLTLSIVRCLLIEVNKESYAIPLARIDRIVEIDGGDIMTLEDKQYISVGDNNVGLVSLRQLFKIDARQSDDKKLLAFVVADRQSRYAVVIDKLIGETDLQVQVLDKRLGKVKDISAAAILDDGSTTLILDVEDMLRSFDKLVATVAVQHLMDNDNGQEQSCKKILVVDDSITVREVERNMLGNMGYQVDVAVDGLDGWNMVNEHDFDLVITDIDMPRMDGIELVAKIKQDVRLRDIPVMIVSYKERSEDRRKGLDAGADYYLTKGSFHDETLKEAVIDLIGEA